MLSPEAWTLEDRAKVHGIEMTVQEDSNFTSQPRDVIQRDWRRRAARTKPHRVHTMERLTEQ